MDTFFFLIRFQARHTSFPFFKYHYRDRYLHFVSLPSTTTTFPFRQPLGRPRYRVFFPMDKNLFSPTIIGLFASGTLLFHPRRQNMSDFGIRITTRSNLPFYISEIFIPHRRTTSRSVRSHTTLTSLTRQPPRAHVHHLSVANCPTLTIIYQVRAGVRLDLTSPLYLIIMNSVDLVILQICWHPKRS